MGASTCLFRSEIPVWIELVDIWSPELRKEPRTKKGRITMRQTFSFSSCEELPLIRVSRGALTLGLRCLGHVATRTWVPFDNLTLKCKKSKAQQPVCTRRHFQLFRLQESHSMSPTNLSPVRPHHKVVMLQLTESTISDCWPDGQQYIA